MITGAQSVPLTPLSKLNRTGLVLAFLLGLVDMSAPFHPPTPDGKVGPPYAILLLDAVLGLITALAVVVAWCTSRRGAIRLAAGARIISMMTALPAFFVDVPTWVKLEVGIFVLLTVGIAALMLTPARRPVPITD